jgi:hypothetical protein
LSKSVHEVPDAGHLVWEVGSQATNLPVSKVLPSARYGNPSVLDGSVKFCKRSRAFAAANFMDVA